MFLRRRSRLVRETDNLTAICELTAHIMWDPQHVPTLLVSTTYNAGNFTFYMYLMLIPHKIHT
jgi:hypothetical protein